MLIDLKTLEIEHLLTDQIPVEGFADVEVALKSDGDHTVNTSWNTIRCFCDGDGDVIKMIQTQMQKEIQT